MQNNIYVIILSSDYRKIYVEEIFPAHQELPYQIQCTDKCDYDVAVDIINSYIMNDNICTQNDITYIGRINDKRNNIINSYFLMINSTKILSTEHMSWINVDNFHSDQTRELRWLPYYIIDKLSNKKDKSYQIIF